MKLSLTLISAFTAASLVGAVAINSRSESVNLDKRWFPITPKVMIISMFSYESVWTPIYNLDQNLTLPGLSPLYPNVTCNADASICAMTTGEAEINAACSVSALVLSSDFDFKSTYFYIAGIAGVNPYTGTLGSVGFARYAVQVALAYEIDARQIPANWTTGYFLQGTDYPGESPWTAGDIYGTEVFELNTNLRDAIMPFTTGVKLNDSTTAAAYRSKYNYAPANQPPTIFYGDVATSDVYFAGNLLDQVFANITQQWTNDTGTYALTAQEDNASFEAMIRADKAGLLDFSRVILMRTASDFDRAPPGVDTVTSFEANQGGFSPAINNIPIVAKPIIDGIISEWDSKFAKGIAPQDGWLFNSDDLHTLSILRRRQVADWKLAEKRSKAMKRY